MNKIKKKITISINATHPAVLATTAQGKEKQVQHRIQEK
jgi:hypothetical protein